MIKGVENIEINSKPIAGKTYVCETYIFCKGYKAFNVNSVKCRGCASFDKCQELDYEVYAS